MSGEEQNVKKTIEFVIIVVLIVNLLFEMQYMSQTTTLYRSSFPITAEITEIGINISFE